MNEPTEHAQKTTGKVTARQLLACLLLGGDALYVHGVATPNRAPYSDSFVFTVSSTKKSRYREGQTQTEQITKLDIPGWISNGSTSEREDRTVEFGRYVQFGGVYAPKKGFVSLSTQRDDLATILSLLPGGAEVSLQVALDYGTHEYLVRADCAMNRETFQGLHADMVYLHATWTARGKTKTARFLLDVSIIPHNTARFGAPGSRLDA